MNTGIRNRGIWDWRYTRNEGYIRGFRTREMLDRRNTEYRTAGLQERWIQYRWYRTRGMQDAWDAGQVGCRTRWKHDRSGAGKERWMKEGTKERRDEEKDKRDAG